MSRWVRKFEAQSQTSDRTYVVSVDDNGEWGCSCPVWKFKRQTCHHILHIKTELCWKDGDMGEVIRLKAELIDRYQKQGKTQEEITRRLVK